MGLLKVMLSRYNMQGKANWLQRARLWRFVLLAKRDGRFEPTPGLAFGLRCSSAVTPEEVVHAKRRGLAGMLGYTTAHIVRKDRGRMGAEATANREGSVGPGLLGSVRSGGPGGQKKVLEAHHRTFHPKGCPLSDYAIDAVAKTLPPELRALVERGSLSGSAAETVWCTALAVAAMEAMDECFLVNEEGETEVTLVDRSTSWLQDQAAAHAGLRAALPGVMADARAHEEAWELRQRKMMGAAKHAAQMDHVFYALGEFQRFVGRVTMIFRRRHETFSILLCPPSEFVQRHQKARRVYGL